jgi:hypothetical protein
MMTMSDEVQERQLAAALEPEDLFVGFLLDVQAHLLGELVRVDSMWGRVTNVATVGEDGSRQAAVVLDGNVERVVLVAEEGLRDVVLDLSDEVVTLFVRQRHRTHVFEVVPR